MTDSRKNNYVTFKMANFLSNRISVSGENVFNGGSYYFTGGKHS